MNTFSSSSRFLDLAFGMRQTLLSGDAPTRQSEPRILAEIARALSRWENEGGAVPVDDTRLMDSYAAVD